MRPQRGTSIRLLYERDIFTESIDKRTQENFLEVAVGSKISYWNFKLCNKK
jgi:hypothetical protein